MSSQQELEHESNAWKIEQSQVCTASNSIGIQTSIPKKCNTKKSTILWSISSIFFTT